MKYYNRILTKDSDQRELYKIGEYLTVKWNITYLIVDHKYNSTMNVTKVYLRKMFDK